MVVIDIGGGWGGDAYAHLKANGVKCVGYLGVDTHVEGRTVDKQLNFFNVRAKAYWRFREALNPDQPGGSRIALPNDKQLIADLCAPRFDVVSNGIKLEPKEAVVKRLGRSPDKGDAVVMAWYSGARMEDSYGKWSKERGGRRRSIAVDLGPRRRN
jgi:hypothetical protein